MEWGTFTDWAMVIVTGAGFVGAVVQLRVNVSDSRAARRQSRQEEEGNREAMARAVGLKSNWQLGAHGAPPAGSELMPVQVEILNSGPYPISSAVLTLQADDDDVPSEVVYGTILPDEHLKDTYGNHWSSSTSWRGLERIEHEAHIC